jgi:hypothetical protein
MSAHAIPTLYVPAGTVAVVFPLTERPSIEKLAQVKFVPAGTCPLVEVLIATLGVPA